jgi:hypothetical protein
MLSDPALLGRRRLECLALRGKLSGTGPAEAVADILDDVPGGWS